MSKAVGEVPQAAYKSSHFSVSPAGCCLRKREQERRLLHLVYNRQNHSRSRTAGRYNPFTRELKKSSHPPGWSRLVMRASPALMPRPCSSCDLR